MRNDRLSTSLFCIFALAIASCSEAPEKKASSKPDQNDPQQQIEQSQNGDNSIYLHDQNEQLNDAFEMIMKNDPKICANKVIIDSAIMLADSNYKKFLEDGGDRLTVDTITVTDIDEKINRIACSSTVRQHNNNITKSIPLAYRLSPMLDSNDVAVEINRNKHLSELVSDHIRQWYERSRNQQGAEESVEGSANQLSSNDDGTKPCLLFINGKKMGGDRCKGGQDVNGEYYLTNERGTVRYAPFTENKKYWDGLWFDNQSENQDGESIGLYLKPVGDCLKGARTTIC